MKEAAGEANMTVVTIILISVIVAIVTPIITSMMKNTGRRTCCMDAGGTYRGGACVDGDGNDINSEAYTTCIERTENTSTTN